MILVEFTPTGGTLHRISTRDIALTHQWYGHIKSSAIFKMTLPEVYGGYAAPDFSDLQISPEMFEDLPWPPTDTADVVISWTDSDEAGAVQIYSGTASLDSFDRDSIVYTLQKPEFDHTVTSGTVYNTTLEGFLTTLCTSLSLSTDYTYGRSTSPNVNFTVADDIQAIDLMSNVCSFMSHGFTVIDGTLYLYDMTEERTITVMDEFDFLPSSYRKGQPLALIEFNNISIDGSNKSGDTLTFDRRYCISGEVADHFGNIKTLIESDILELNCMISVDRPKILQTISTVDESTIQTTNFTGNITSVIYNFDTEKMQVEAIGLTS